MVSGVTVCVLALATFQRGVVSNTLLLTLAKICQEIHLKWDQTLFIDFLQIRVAPRSGYKLSPFEIVYERPFQICFKSTHFVCGAQARH